MTPRLTPEQAARKGIVDRKLKASRWEVVPHRSGATLRAYHRQAVEEHPTAEGPADYALIVDGQILGIVEAKKLGHAILARAFRGELVPAQAELARREGREYEPAAEWGQCARAEQVNQRHADTAASNRSGIR